METTSINHWTSLYTKPKRNKKFWDNCLLVHKIRKHRRTWSGRGPHPIYMLGYTVLSFPSSFERLWKLLMETSLLGETLWDEFDFTVTATQLH